MTKRKVTLCNHPDFNEAVKMRRYQLARTREEAAHVLRPLECITDAAYVVVAARVFYPMEGLKTKNTLIDRRTMYEDNMKLHYWRWNGVVTRFLRTEQAYGA